jgi:hypothetical protein
MKNVLRNRHRRRREVSSSTATILSPLFRYSRTRDAYVLRLIGDRLGPVLRVGPSSGNDAPRPGGVETEDAAPPKSGRFERAEPVTEQTRR